MNAKIPPEIVAKATRCDCDHACIHKDAAFRCPIEEIVGNAVVFVTYVPNLNCGYRTSFGEGFVCTCPVRVEDCRRRHA